MLGARRRRGLHFDRLIGWSCGDRFRLLEEAAVWKAFRPCGQTFVRQGKGDVALPRSHRSLSQRPVDHVALRVAAAHLPQVEARRQQVLHRLSVRAMVEGGQRLHDGQTDIAIDRSQLSAIGRGFAHCLQPALERSGVAGSQLCHGSMNVGEDVQLAIGMALPLRREVLPSVAHIASQRLQPPQQGYTIADAHAGRTHRREDRPIIDLKRGVVLAELDMK